MPDVSKRDLLVTQNLALVHSLCRHFVGKGIEYDDLFGVGSVGLVKAANNFEEERGLCFSTYAVPVILGEIRRIFRDGGSIKVSRSLKELSLKASKAQNELSKKIGREPTLSELGSYMNCPVEDLTEALAAARPVASLDFTDADSDKKYNEPAAPDESELIFNRIAVGQAARCLDDEERALLNMRYFKELTQSETAKRLKMSQVQVSRKEKKILLKMRTALCDAGCKDTAS